MNIILDNVWIFLGIAIALIIMASFQYTMSKILFQLEKIEELLRVQREKFR